MCVHARSNLDVLQAPLAPQMVYEMSWQEVAVETLPSQHAPQTDRSLNRGSGGSVAHVHSPETRTSPESRSSGDHGLLRENNMAAKPNLLNFKKAVFVEFLRFSPCWVFAFFFFL